MHLNQIIKHLSCASSLIVGTLSQEVDIVLSGNYLIQGCGTHANAIQTVLAQTYEFITNATTYINPYDLLTNSVGPSNPNAAAYANFLDGVATESVVSLFQNIAAGTNLSIAGASQHPTLGCIITMSEEYAEVCDDDGFGAAWVNGTQFIMICPIFLQSKAIKAYPVAADCATQEDLWVNQYSILVHELIHLYLGTLGKAALVPEVYNSTECMGLSAADALINPHNYAYYVGNVKAGCTDVFETTLPPTTGSSDLTNLASQYKEVVPLNKSCAIGTNELTYLNCSTDNLFLADDATAK